MLYALDCLADDTDALEHSEASTWADARRAVEQQLEAWQGRGRALITWLSGDREKVLLRHLVTMECGLPMCRLVVPGEHRPALEVLREQRALGSVSTSTRMPAPGTLFGPCMEGCKHADCAALRALSRKLCRHCGGAIGFNRAFLREGPSELVHATCAPTSAAPAGRSP